MNKPIPKIKKSEIMPPPSPMVIKITKSDSGISGMIMVKNPISKKLRDKIVREWNKSNHLITYHDNF